jgi:para-aminobenzoate synthetase component 1
VLTHCADREGVFLLESALRPGRRTRWSYLGLEPFETLSAKGRRTWREAGGRREDLDATAFNALRDALRPYQSLGIAEVGEDSPEFVGGALGYLGYELGRLVERLPGSVPDDLGLPDMHLGLYDRVLAYDHEREVWHASALAFDDTDPAAAVEELQDLLRRVQPETRNSERGTGSLGSAETLRSNFSEAEYEAAVARVIEYIRAGDIFQANFTQRFEAHWPLGAAELYRRLRSVNPAPFAGYYDFGVGQVVSASPELFLHVADRRVETRPIKGTRPRGQTPEADARLGTELRASAKDRAELTMIVDLERNDLGRVCDYGTVRVAEHLALESYPTVHHLVSTVVGELHEVRDVVDLLKATFPGGSITGAPKVRAMEIIDELERSTRGVYTGALGFVGFDGHVELNLPIRTFTLTGGKAYFGVGGGVVADSSPAGEYQESLDKARGLIAALESASAAEAAG